MNSARAKLNIGGMTCVNCQNKIERALNALDSVHAAVKFESGISEIEYDPQIISLSTIKQTIIDLGYDILPENRSSWGVFLRTVCLLLIILAAHFLLQRFGLLNLLTPNQLAADGMSLGMLFVIGLITSVHCIAMCGGINLSQSIPTADDNANNTRRGAFLPTVLYNTGRVVSYTVVGFVLGGVGALIGAGQGGISALFQGILKLIAGVFMVIMGLNMLNLFPWLKKLNIRMPKALAKKVNEGKRRSARPFMVGLLNGLMPCGPLQSMQIIALASGNPFIGAVSMFMFSLGTVPLMLGLGSLVSALGRRFSKAVMGVGAALVVILGLSMLSQGGSLSGLLLPDTLLWVIAALCVIGIVASVPFSKKLMRVAALSLTCALIFLAAALASRFVPESHAYNAMLPEMKDGVQLVESELSSGKFPSITVRAGIPVRWNIEAKQGSINGCNYRMIINELGLEHTFTEGENILEFTLPEAGTVQYTCWMGMIHGTITVVDGEKP